MVPVPGDEKDKVEPRFPIVSPYPSYEFDGTKFKLGSTTPGKGAVGKVFRATRLMIRADARTSTEKRLNYYRCRSGGCMSLKTERSLDLTRRKDCRGDERECLPVSRVAFWTDDDCSRLNINTASEGTYWTHRTSVRYRSPGQLVESR